MSFRYPCFRELKVYAGRTLAVYQVIELAVKEFQTAATQSENEEDYIRDAAKKHGLHVHFARCPDIVTQVIAIQIANVHEALQDFLKSFRIESGEMLGLTWTDYDRKSDLYIAIQNIFLSQKEGRRRLGEMQVVLCEYYRRVRNAVIHGKKERSTLEENFNAVVRYREQAREEYANIEEAPNRFSELTRDDFQLFVRVAQDVAWRLCQATRPTNEQLLASFEAKVEMFRGRWPQKSERVRVAVINFLTRTYGLDRDEAHIILGSVH